MGPQKSVLEIGPGTGQATEPILQTGCDYHAIELGEHLYAKMREKYDRFQNFQIVNDDFITHDFYGKREMSTDEYVSFCGTHCDHIVIPEPYKTAFLLRSNAEI
ncbi:rRNA adenine N-6-methyltransferase family protein [Butyrivibrio sp. NC2002]|uniref:rRNA adenine N-6-methyltransferase family protein n=1 Tax=Butyrivibrio sp. NC2002 TaxID=1410610 RepID=UPI0009E07BD8|nr:rRNA adenine N-6-methyltransferase family protein [Butyrivibrio sp. NC2002]